MSIDSKTSKTYLMILPVGYYRVDSQTVALESAFAEHLRLLKTRIFPLCQQFVVGMVEMDIEEYEPKTGLTVINEQEEHFLFISLYRSKDLSSSINKIRQLFSVSSRLKKLVKDCDILHTGLSSNIWFPMEFIATLWGTFLKKKIIYVVDIDFRNSAFMNYKTGKWSLKSYLLCKYIYDKLREIQIKFAVEQYSLVLLKGKKLCKDFGRGKPNVKFFLDAAYSEKYIIDQNALKQKLSHLLDNQQPLEVVYFGRLTDYKGVDLCIRAVAIAHQQMGCNVIFNVLGDGEQAESLKKLANELGLEKRVIFYGALQFNLDFFKQLYAYHLLLAAPLSEDTPRSALDAMAAGIPILAFDTYYYKDLTYTGAVDTVPWLSVEKLAEKITYYEKNREVLSARVLKAIDFAKQNTQEQWLDRRIKWTLDYAALQ
ncbi:glycosyltransferase [Trichothermofontia sp.]